MTDLTSLKENQKQLHVVFVTIKHPKFHTATLTEENISERRIFCPSPELAMADNKYSYQQGYRVNR